MPFINPLKQPRSHSRYPVFPSIKQWRALTPVVYCSFVLSYQTWGQYFKIPNKLVFYYLSIRLGKLFKGNTSCLTNVGIAPCSHPYNEQLLNSDRKSAFNSNRQFTSEGSSKLLPLIRHQSFDQYFCRFHQHMKICLMISCSTL